MDEALSVIDSFAPDIAVLVMNLGNGQTSLPIARALVSSNTPFFFLTGYSRSYASDDARIKTVPRLQKPVSEIKLRDILLELSEMR